MTTTFINTNDIARVKLPAGQGAFAEILNRDLCGAENVVGTLRWLGAGETLQTPADSSNHQLIYLMEGEGVITLDAKDYQVGKGAGIYLGPKEAANIRQAGAAPLKLFHLVVPKKTA
ncbi:MAG: cupin domain-containing protein [Xanthobacteraceae bacterium]|nr:MAG: cupin domain-containing protein [Xanthobacteraceae bacterium]